MKLAAYIFIGLVVIIMLAFFLLGKKSQKGSAPGLLDGRLAPCSSKPNCVSSEDGASAKHKIDPLKNVALTDVQKAVEKMGGDITSSQNGYFSAEFSSGIFKFVDDVEARQDGDNVQIRSASRVGYSDNGVNGNRMQVLRAALKQDE